MDHDEVLWQCFRYFAHMDEANAAIHCAPVRYSPITFRLAELLEGQVFDAIGGSLLVADVLDHKGAYEEDPGR